MMRHHHQVPRQHPEPSLASHLLSGRVLASLAFIALLSASGFAAAQAGVTLLDDQTPLVQLACGVFNALVGPAAFIIALLVLVIGGIAIAIGGKRVIGGVVWGVLGVGIAISAAQIVVAIGFDPSDNLCGVTGSISPALDLLASLARPLIG